MLAQIKVGIIIWSTARGSKWVAEVRWAKAEPDPLVRPALLDLL